MDVKQLRCSCHRSSVSEEDSLEVFYLRVPCSTSSDEPEMSSQPVGMPSEPQTTEIEEKTAAERRENNRIAQQRSRRNTRSELIMLRHKSVKYYERHVELRNQLLRASHEKNEALVRVQAQKKQIEEMDEQLRNCVQDYGELHRKFTILISAHCELLQRTNAVAHVSAAQAPPKAQRCMQKGTRLA